MMGSERRYMVYGIGNGIVDQQVKITDGELEDLRLSKGFMELADQAEQGRILAYLGNRESELHAGGSAANTVVGMAQMGGAVARVGEDATAFNGRNAGFTFNINGNSLAEDGFAAERDWARRYWQALAPHHTSVYVNFLMEEGEERIKQAYGAEKYARLKALKRKYDPTNFFRLNQNINPN